MASIYPRAMFALLDLALMGAFSTWSIREKALFPPGDVWLNLGASGRGRTLMHSVSFTRKPLSRACASTKLLLPLHGAGSAASEAAASGGVKRNTYYRPFLCTDGEAHCGSSRDRANGVEIDAAAVELTLQLWNAVSHAVPGGCRETCGGIKMKVA